MRKQILPLSSSPTSCLRKILITAFVFNFTCMASPHAHVPVCSCAHMKARQNVRIVCCFWSTTCKFDLQAAQCHHQKLGRIFQCWSIVISCRLCHCQNNQCFLLSHWESHQHYSAGEKKNTVRTNTVKVWTDDVWNVHHSYSYMNTVCEIKWPVHWSHNVRLAEQDI